MMKKLQEIVKPYLDKEVKISTILPDSCLSDGPYAVKFQGIQSSVHFHNPSSLLSQEKSGARIGDKNGELFCLYYPPKAETTDKFYNQNKEAIQKAEAKLFDRETRQEGLDELNALIQQPLKK